MSKSCWEPEVNRRERLVALSAVAARVGVEGEELEIAEGEGWR